MITRRDFLRWSGSAGAALGISALELSRLERVLAAEPASPLIWLHGSGCSGCSTAALNAVSPMPFDGLLSRVSVKYDSMLMAAGADLALRTLDLEARAATGRFILVVEGGVPTAEGGRCCVIGERQGVPLTLLQALGELGPMASQVIALGTCAAYRGVSGTGGNPANVLSVREVLAGKTAKPVLNIPGCPAPPEVLLRVLVAILAGGTFTLDQSGRPSECFPHTVHFVCPRKYVPKAKLFGDPGCFRMLGCRGEATTAMCPRHKWNNGRNWCVQAGYPCIGCAAPSFPQSPLLVKPLRTPGT